MPAVKLTKKTKDPLTGIEITYKWNDLGEIIKSGRSDLEYEVKFYTKRMEEVIRNYYKNYKKYGLDYEKYDWI